MVDIEGTANIKVISAASVSDMVIIPCRRSKLDARSAIEAFITIRGITERIDAKVQTCLLINATNPAIRTKRLTEMRTDLLKSKINAFNVELIDREAFKAIFDEARLLQQLPDSFTGKGRAIENAQAFLEEALIDKLKLVTKDKKEAA